MASRRLLVASLATLRAARGFLPHASRRRHFGAPRAEEDYIESTTNALVKRFKRCPRKKPRDAEGVVLVEGRAFVSTWTLWSLDPGADMALSFMLSAGTRVEGRS